jgi:hypothetical protein
MPLATDHDVKSRGEGRYVNSVRQQFIFPVTVVEFVLRAHRFFLFSYVRIAYHRLRTSYVLLVHPAQNAPCICEIRRNTT